MTTGPLAKTNRVSKFGEITFDVFEMPAETDLSIATYSVDEGSESAGKFALLASWAATQEFDTKHLGSGSKSIIVLVRRERPVDGEPVQDRS